MVLVQLLLLFLSGNLLVSGACSPPARPTWYSRFSVDGVIVAPDAEVSEPFTAYYSKGENRHRADYYNGLVKTYQHRSTCYRFQYVSKPPNVLNKLECHRLDCEYEKITHLPPITDEFKFVGRKTVRGKSCEIWKEDGRPLKHRIMYVHRAGSSVYPVRLETRSSFGEYRHIDYDNYRQLTTQQIADNDIFDLPENPKCNLIKNPTMEERLLMNPIMEYVDDFDGHIAEMFDQFKIKHGVKYPTEGEHETRKINFRRNVQYIHSTNRKGLSFRVAVNHLADRSREELGNICGNMSPEKHINSTAPFVDLTDADLKDLPDDFDWRLYGAVTPVKDQLSCGSCYAFGAVGAIEGAYFLKHHVLKSFSEQEIMDCSWGFDNSGCMGGFSFLAYEYATKFGLASDENYGGYLAVEGKCKVKDVKASVWIQKWQRGNMDKLKAALLKHGPPSISLAVPLSFCFYSYGVYERKHDDKIIGAHSLVAVGYGVQNNKPYWLIKNSWSAEWGLNGYVLMSEKDHILSGPVVLTVL